MKMEGGRNSGVVAIECVAGSSKAEEWDGGAVATLQAGDIMEEVTFGGTPPALAPFKGGRAAVMKLLHQAYKRGDTSVILKARRGPAVDSTPLFELQACIVPHPTAGRRQYVLRSIRDPNLAFGLVDSSESECLALQGSRSSRVVCALGNAQLQDGYVSYPWEQKMRESLPMLQNSSSFLSLLFLPKASDASGTRYNSLEDTLARANAWLNASQASGVPILFMNIQSEALLTKISGETASSTVNMGSLADLSNMANVSLYGFEDYHGVDIGVVRAVRLWYTPIGGELKLEIKLQEGDTKLGFAISRTEEGFIYISSVADEDNPGVAATRSGLRELYREARRASNLLVVSRVANEKVLPWMVSTSGSIRSFDTVSLSQKLSLHRHAMKPILLHLLMWDDPSSTSKHPTATTFSKSAIHNDQRHELDPPPPTATNISAASSPAGIFAPRAPAVEEASDLPAARSFLPPSPVDEVLEDLVYRPVGSDAGLERDRVGDGSFRFHS